MTPAVFLYGTLRHARLMRLIAGAGPGQAHPAVLAGHVVERQRDSDLPMILARPGAACAGDLWTGLSAAQLARLDAYELPFGYTRRTLTVTRDDGAQVEAEVYFPPEGLTSSGAPFDLSLWEARMGAATLAAAAEIDSHDPPLDAAALSRQWGMISHRASAKLRARASTAPTTVRRRAGEGDREILSEAPVTGGFFKFRQLQLRHRRFDGSWSETLPREVYQGVDAALVLPYDPKTDRVLLVEQFRTGPFAREDANPWTLEPVAGMVDAGETPEDCARREAMEEAGLALGALEPITQYYPSPGGSSEYFYCYLGLVSLPVAGPYHGGLAEEHEDLRLHVLSFDAALALVTSGEINVGPLVTMLFWLRAERSRLRGL